MTSITQALHRLQRQGLLSVGAGFVTNQPDPMEARPLEVEMQHSVWEANELLRETDRGPSFESKIVAIDAAGNLRHQEDSRPITPPTCPDPEALMRTALACERNLIERDNAAVTAESYESTLNGEATENALAFAAEIAARNDSLIVDLMPSARDSSEPSWATCQQEMPSMVGPDSHVDAPVDNTAPLVNAVDERAFEELERLMGSLSGDTAADETLANVPGTASNPPLLELPENWEVPLREVELRNGYARLVEQVDHDLPARGAGSILIFGSESETHTTTVALQLAIFQADDKMRRVLLVDGHGEPKSLSHRAKIAQTPGLLELVKHSANWEQVIWRTPRERLFVLSSGARREAETVDEVAVLSLIQELNNNFDLVIVDGGRGDSPLFAPLFQACDCAYLIARLGKTPRMQGVQRVQALRDANLIPTGCIVTNSIDHPVK